METIEYYRYKDKDQWLYLCYKQKGDEWEWDEYKLTEGEFKSKYPESLYKLFELQITD
jgi:hypothetical protein